MNEVELLTDNKTPKGNYQIWEVKKGGRIVKVEGNFIHIEWPKK